MGDLSITPRTSPVSITAAGVLTGKSILKARASATHSLVIDTNGVLYGFGSNSNGELGIGNASFSSDPVAVQITGTSLFGLQLSGASLGTNFTVILTNNNMVHTFGDNSEGALGDGTTNSRSFANLVPGLTNVAGISAHHRHVLAYNSSHFMSWGANSSYKVILNLQY